MSKLQHSDLHICVLAAGKGKRMRSSLPKVLHKVLGRAMIEHVLESATALSPKVTAVVTGHGSEMVREHIGELDNLEWVVQDQQLGTGHAVQQCESVIDGVRDVLIVCGDTPLLTTDTLAQLVHDHREKAADITILTARPANPYGYGRIVRNASGHVASIVEERDATGEQKQINEVSSGIYCVRHEVLFNLLHAVGNNNAQGEYYLPDIVPLALQAGQSVEAVVMENPDEMLGVNDRLHLANVEEIMQRHVIEAWQRNGVTIEKPGTVRIEVGVEIGSDTLIQAGCHLVGTTQIGSGCSIGPYTVIIDAEVADRAHVQAFSHLQDCSVGAESMVGPYARLRPETCLAEKVRIGNFVEVKKSVIGHGSKINHLSYIGDTTMGSACNIGAGTITCNYDGANKHRTEVGDNVFIGSDSQMVAPVSIGDGATVGAGSTITRDVPEGGLTLSQRNAQRHLASWKRPEKKR